MKFCLFWARPQQVSLWIIRLEFPFNSAYLSHICSVAVTLQAQFDWYYAAVSLSKARPPPLKKRLQEHMLNCDPSIYVHHVALLSSGSNHISTVSFYPLSICPFWRDLTVKQKVSLASRLFLWRSSPPLINPLCPFVAHPTHQPSRQAQSNLLLAYFCLFLLTRGNALQLD